MTNNLITHRDLAHRAIDIDIDNINDELHDRDFDALADAIDPHTESLRTLLHSLHDTLCDIDDDIDAPDIDDLAFDDESTPCLDFARDALSSLAYSHYRD